MTAFSPVSASAADPFADELGIVWDCAYSAPDAFLSRVREGAPRRAACLAGAGFLAEANKAEDPTSALGRFVSVLHQDPAVTVAGEPPVFLSDAVAAGSAEAAFWLLSLYPDRSSSVPDRRLRRAAVARFLEKPSWVHYRYGRALAEGLLTHRDPRTGLGLAAGINAKVVSGASVHNGDLATLIDGLMREAVGDESAARNRFAAVDQNRDTATAVEARFRMAVLTWRRGEMTTETAADTLRGLSIAWPHGRLGMQIGMAHARALDFDGRPLAAATELVRVHERVQGEAGREVRRRLEDVVAKALDDAARQPMDALLAYRMAQPVLDPSRFGTPLDLKAAVTFAELGLNAAAREAVLRFGRAPREGMTRPQMMDVAGVYVSLGQGRAAAPWLAASRRDADAPPTDEWTRLSLAALESDQLRTVSPSGLPQSARAVLADRAWHEGIYGLSDRMARAGDGPLDEDARMLAAYLGAGTRPTAAAGTDQPMPPLRAALVRRPTPLARAAFELRPRLEGAAAVLAFADYLDQSASALSLSPVSGDPL